MSLFTPTPLSTHTTAAPMRASPIVAAMPPYWIRSSFWNPDGVELPGCVNLKSPPSYLDKSLVGDVGFDPLCLVPFANPQSPTAVLDVPLSAEEVSALWEETHGRYMSPPSLPGSTRCNLERL